MANHRETTEAALMADAWIGYLVVRGFTALIAGGVGLTLLAEFWAGGLVIVFAVAVAAPRLVAESLLRIGWWRLAGWQAAANGFDWGLDRQGARLVMAAHHLLRNPDDTTCAEWLSARLRAQTKPLPCAILAAGVLHHREGRSEAARRLWRLVASFDRAIRPVPMWKLAADLLVGSAVSDGKFFVLAAPDPRQASTNRTRLLRWLQRHPKGTPVPTRVQIAIRFWLVHPAWTELAARVLATAAEEPAPPPAATVADVVKDTARARLRPSRAAVARSAMAWEALLDSESVDKDRQGELRATVVDLLVRALDEAPPGSEACAGALWREVVWQVADQRDADLQVLSDDLAARADASVTAFSVFDEVDAWCRLVDAFEAVVAIDPDRASASFAKLYYNGVRHTVWLHNERNQAPVANAMYRILLGHAEVAAHDSGVGLLQRNLACGP